MKKKISAVVAVSMIATNISPVINVYANEVVKEKAKLIETKEIREAQIKKFDLKTYSNFEEYNSKFRVNKDEIKTISNNGGKYASSSIEKAIDNNLSTHWETGKPNSETFKNEVVIEFNNLETIDRIAYATRQDGAKGKGFPNAFEVYSSITGKDEDFKLVSTGSHSTTGDMMEFKFDTITTKKVKFVFKEANQGWASASEFWFYREDKIIDKLNKIFTDNSMNQLSEEFNTMEKLNAFEEEAKNHPLYNNFKEDIENAKLILENKDVKFVNAKVSPFINFGDERLPKYDNSFKVSSDKITSITTNGGHYGSSNIEKAIDSDVNTSWHSGKQNSDTHTNEVVLTLDKTTLLNRIVYTGAQSAYRGFAENFEIYASTTSKGDTFKLVSSGVASKTKDSVEIKFNPTEFKRVKFVFKKGYENWALASEFGLYYQDEVKDKVEDLFTNNLYNELKKEYKSIEVIENLEKEANNHPLKDTLMEKINIAKDILNNKQQTIKIVEAEQHGNMEKHARETLKFGFGSNNQPTGVLAKPGEQLVVYVEAEQGKPLPKIFFSQQEGSWASWGRTIDLKPGKNIITVPKVSQEAHYGHKVVSGGPVYLINPYTEQEQGKAPIVRFESGAELFPYFDENTNEKEFIEFLKEYKAKVDEDVKANPDVANRQVIDTFEFKTEHMFFTGTTSGAYEAYVNKGVKPLDTIKSWNNYMKVLFKYYGLDGNNEYDDPKYIRENIRLAQPWGYMYAAGDHIGVQGDVMTNLCIPFEDRKGSNWGITHEIGHRMDMQKRLYGESTNNMLALYMDYYYELQPGNSVPYEKIYENVMSENSNEFVTGGYFERIAPFWQLELYYPGYWAEFNSYYRERDKDITILSGDKQEESKTKYIVEFSSEILGVDLSEYFARHGFLVTDEVKTEMATKYKKTDKKLWYLNDKVVKYNGQGFVDGVQTKLNLSNENEKIKLKFSVTENGKDALLGYEILKNGEVIGFTEKEYFVDEASDLTKNDKYTVIAYDRKLNTNSPVTLNSQGPKLIVNQNNVTIKLNEEFNPSDYFTATDYNGNNIKSDVKIIKNNINTNKHGEYDLVLEVESNGCKIRENIKVNVVSNYDYLSDLEVISSKVGYGKLEKDKSPDGGTITLLNNGNNVTYKKGIGAHANSEIVYNVENKGYDYFESNIGIDQSRKGKNSSATFEVYVDGEKKYSSKTFKADTNVEHIKVDIKGAKEVKLVTTDANDSNSNDHTIWGEAKFTTNNSKPSLTIPESIATKIGEPININEEFSAIDVEDGDITKKVEVTGKIDFNKSGKYIQTYKVSDSNGNEVTKTRAIYVVNMEDSEYLSDYNWKLANIGWSSIKKDKSVSGNAIRLTNVDNKEVSYQKGIGTHATSNIIYDLTDIDASYFTSYIGVDRQMFGTVGSVEFKVLLDGKEVYNSGLMKSKDVQKYIEINIAGSKELKLVVTDGNNGIGSDHANWADAKLHFAKEGTSNEVVN